MNEWISHQEPRFSLARRRVCRAVHCRSGRDPGGAGEKSSEPGPGRLVRLAPLALVLVVGPSGASARTPRAQPRATPAVLRRGAPSAPRDHGEGLSSGTRGPQPAPPSPPSPTFVLLRPLVPNRVWEQPGCRVRTQLPPFLFCQEEGGQAHE